MHKRRALLPSSLSFLDYILILAGTLQSGDQCSTIDLCSSASFNCKLPSFLKLTDLPGHISQRLPWHHWSHHLLHMLSFPCCNFSRIHQIFWPLNAMLFQVPSAFILLVESDFQEGQFDHSSIRMQLQDKIQDIVKQFSLPAIDWCCDKYSRNLTAIIMIFSINF